MFAEMENGKVAIKREAFLSARSCEAGKLLTFVIIGHYKVENMK